MVVCQYFLQGRCHFGANCRNEHIYNNEGGRGKNSGNNQLYNIVWQISNKVIAAEKGGQWLLSCFAPIKEGPCLPGWEDISPEEVRWTLYEARKNGTVNQALNQINQWYKNAEKARNLLKHPTPEVTNMLNDILRGKKLAQTDTGPSGSFTVTPDPKSTFRFDTAVANIFGKPASTTQSSGSIFERSATGFQSQGIFGNSTAQTAANSSNIFSRPESQESNQNIFSTSSSANQNVFSQSASSQIFSGPTSGNIFQPQQSQNVFMNSPVPAFGALPQNSVFGSQSNQFQTQPPTNTPAFNTPIFTLQNVTHHSESASVPAAASTPIPTPTLTTAPVKEVDTSIYSKLEDLNENEIKAFTSTTFAFGQIPLKPPPQQYC